MGKKTAEKDLLILKQDKKIRELSENNEENYKLKNLLDNMEDKLSERDHNSSFDKHSEKIEKRGKSEKIGIDVQFQLRDVQRLKSGEKAYKNYNPERRSYRTRDAWG